MIQRFLTDDVLTRVQNLRPVADELGLSMAQLAIAWVLQNDNVAAALVGASRPEQVAENVKASGVTIPAELMTRIDEILGAPSSATRARRRRTPAGPRRLTDDTTRRRPRQRAGAVVVSSPAGRGHASLVRPGPAVAGTGSRDAVATSDAAPAAAPSRPSVRAGSPTGVRPAAGATSPRGANHRAVSCTIGPTASA